MTTTSDVLLKVSGLKVAYGGIQAVKGVSFEVRAGEFVSLIGANGAGKTTTLKALTGLQPIADGEVEFLGRSTRGQGAWDLARQGLVMVPEGRGTFTRMTITENLQMGAFVRRDNEITADMDRVFGIFPKDFVSGLIKPFAFGAIITLTASFYGLNTRGGTEGVGLAATRSVVTCSVLILAMDYVLTQLLLVLLPPG